MDNNIIIGSRGSKLSLAYANKVKELIQEVFNNSYSLTNQINEISNMISNNKKLNDNTKSLILKKLVEVDQYLVKGCDEFIQYYNLFFYIMDICQKK